MLLLDIGNTRIKWARWRQRTLVGARAQAYDRQALAHQLQQWFNRVAADEPVVVCSVAGASLDATVRDWFVDHGKRAPLFVQSKKHQGGVINHYWQPERLGVDRWVAMIGAHDKFTNNLCVISCGSALTVDVVTATGEHQGGLIMPGISMMRKSLLEETAGITDTEGEMTGLADNTADAVYSGCFQLVVAGLTQLLRDFSADYGGDMQCVITGGDGAQVAEAMAMNCSYDANLILHGLGLIADEIL